MRTAMQRQRSGQESTVKGQRGNHVDCTGFDRLRFSPCEDDDDASCFPGYARHRWLFDEKVPPSWARKESHHAVEFDLEGPGRDWLAFCCTHLGRSQAGALLFVAWPAGDFVGWGAMKGFDCPGGCSSKRDTGSMYRGYTPTVSEGGGGSSSISNSSSSHGVIVHPRLHAALSPTRPYASLRRPR